MHALLGDDVPLLPGRSGDRAGAREAYAILMELPAPVAVLEGPAHSFRMGNLAWRKQFAGQGPPGRPIGQMVPELDHAEILAVLDRAYLHDETTAIGEIPICVDPDAPGAAFFYNVTAQPIHAAAGAVTGVVLLCADITPQVLAGRAARVEAHSANRLKDQLLAAISHDLRAPLAALLLWENVLRQTSSDPALQRRALDAIHDSATTQSRLVEELLDASRAIDGRRHADLRPIALDRNRSMAPPAKQAVADLQGVSVLLVDDDPLVRKALGLLLTRVGAVVQCAESAQAAWNALERGTPDVIVSDIAMPDDDGHAFMRRVRRHARGAAHDVPAIALTGYVATEERDRGPAGNFARVLAKPVDIDRLVAAINDCVARRRVGKIT